MFAARNEFLAAIGNLPKEPLRSQWIGHLLDDVRQNAGKRIPRQTLGSAANRYG
jgi:hypothetical protein